MSTYSASIGSQNYTDSIYPKKEERASENGVKNSFKGCEKKEVDRFAQK